MAKKLKKDKKDTKRPPSSNNVQVVARFRPQNAREIREKGEVCMEINDEGTHVTVEVPKNGKHSFNFDKIFGMETKQDDVYQVVGLPIVEDIFNGYNGTVFVYGQTGAGKSFSMMGPNVEGTGYCDDPDLKGLIPRIVENIFDTVMNSEDHLEFTIQVSYIEIYMEKIRDLFDPSRDNLQIKEDRESGKGIYVDGCKNEYVTNVDEVFKLMKTGASNRVVAGHLQNAESSRSHSIFIINLQRKDLQKMESRSGTLFLVDLAGSEKVKKTHAEGQLLEEAKTINKSLSALGNVINALTDGKAKHVPYRDSKLTRLLQDSLGGNCRTTLVICCSPSSWNGEETLSTLRFGNRAKSIKNNAKVNKEYTAKELKKMLDKTKKELKSMKSYAEGLEEELKLIKINGTSETSTDGTSTTITLEKLPHVAELKDRNEELEKLLEEEKKRVEELLDLKEKLEDESNDYKLKLENVEAQLKETEEAFIERDEAAVQLEASNVELENLRTKIESLEHELTEKTLEIDSLRSERDMLEGEIKILNQDKVQIQEVSADVLMKAYEDLVDVDATSPLQSPQSQLQLGGQEQDNIIQTEIPSLTPLKSQVLETQLSDNNNDENQENNQIETDSNLHKENSDLRDENKYFMEMIQKLSERNSTLEERNTKLEKVCKQLKSQKSALMQDLRNRCDKVVELSVNLDEIQDENNRIKNLLQTKDLPYQFEQMRKQFIHIRKNYQEVVNKLSNLEMQKKIVDNKLNIRNERIQGLDQALQKVIAKNNAQSDRFLQYRSKAIQQEQSMQKEIDLLKLQIKELQSVINNTTTQQSENRVVKLRGGKKTNDLPPSIRGGGGTNTSTANTSPYTPRSDNSSSYAASSAYSTPSQISQVESPVSTTPFSLSDIFFSGAKSPLVTSGGNVSEVKDEGWVEVATPMRKEDIEFED